MCDPGDRATGECRRCFDAEAPLLSWSRLFAIVPAHAQEKALAEPPIGSAERKAILDALRGTGEIPDRIFVVRSMRVQNGWAWVVVDPESWDRSSHYETESALLREHARNWKVIDRPCEEERCDPSRAVTRIRAAHPDAPAAIFPP